MAIKTVAPTPPRTTVTAGTSRGGQMSKGPAFTPVLGDLGTTFFPIGVWLQTPESVASTYAAMGVNTFVGLFNGPTTSNLTAVRDAGMYAIVGVGTGGWSAQQTAALALASDLKARILAWMPYDEPDLPVNGCVSPATMTNTYNAMKAADPLRRPVFVNFNQDVANGDPATAGCFEFHLYAPTCDVSAFDIYPVNDGYALHGVGLGIGPLKSWLGHPAWAFIETTHFEGATSPHNGNPSRAPTPVETKTELWDAIIRGATGIVYFAHASFDGGNTLTEAGLSNVAYASMRTALATVNAQIQSLAPVILTAPAASQATVSVVGGVEVNVTTRVYGGATYVFAANVGGKSSTTTATYTVPGFTTGTATVIDESRTIPLVGGQFTDTFGNSGYVDSLNSNAALFYGVHLYKVTSP